LVSTTKLHSDGLTLYTKSQKNMTVTVRVYTVYLSPVYAPNFNSSPVRPIK